MFGLFRKKKTIPQCEHEWIGLGKFYKVYDSEYRNVLDYVTINMRLICPKCNNVIDKELSTRGFAPSAYTTSDEKQTYLNILGKDIIKDYEMEEKTITFKYNIKNIEI